MLPTCNDHSTLAHPLELMRSLPDDNSITTTNKIRISIAGTDEYPLDRLNHLAEIEDCSLCKPIGVFSMEVTLNSFYLTENKQCHSCCERISRTSNIVLSSYLILQAYAIIEPIEKKTDSIKLMPVLVQLSNSTSTSFAFVSK